MYEHEMLDVYVIRYVSPLLVMDAYACSITNNGDDGAGNISSNVNSRSECNPSHFIHCRFGVFGARMCVKMPFASMTLQHRFGFHSFNIVYSSIVAYSAHSLFSLNYCSLTTIVNCNSVSHFVRVRLITPSATRRCFVSRKRQ